MRILIRFACLILLGALASSPAAEAATKLERLEAAGRLWVDIGYFHPRLAYRDIDWDRAFVEAVPRIEAADSAEDYAAAVASMLVALDDPATRVLPGDIPSFADLPQGEAFSFERTEDNIAILTFRPTAELEDYQRVVGRVRNIGGGIESSEGVVLDLRSDVELAERGWTENLLEMAGLSAALVTEPLQGPGERARLHSGLGAAPSPMYFSAFYTKDGELFEGSEAAREQPIVFS